MSISLFFLPTSFAMDAENINPLQLERLELKEQEPLTEFHYFEALPEPIKCHIIEQHAKDYSKELSEPKQKYKALFDLTNVNRSFFKILTRQPMLIWALEENNCPSWANYILSNHLRKITPDITPNKDDSKALVHAAQYNHTFLCRRLLEWPTNPAHADAHDSQALCWAATNTNQDLCYLLLEAPFYRARANAQKSQALICVADKSSSDNDTSRRALEIARMLLTQNQHPATADAQDSQALICAAQAAFLDMCKLLLKWPVNPARADAQNSEALIRATKSSLGEYNRNYWDICELLLSHKDHPAKADDQQSLALIQAAKIADNTPICGLLLQQESHPARIETDNFKALEVAASVGDLYLCSFFLLEASEKGLTAQRLLEIAESPDTHLEAKTCFLEWNQQFNL
jgi:ankyrin repeat protein